VTEPSLRPFDSATLRRLLLQGCRVEGVHATDPGLATQSAQPSFDVCFVDVDERRHAGDWLAASAGGQAPTTAAVPSAPLGRQD
jgi:hypothetical protein